jgi:hypothetical protein
MAAFRVLDEQIRMIALDGNDEVATLLPGL